MVGDTDLLDMLASETSRRSEALIAGIQELSASGQPDPEKVEALRVDAHGIKGAAMVVGQERLAELARLIEAALAARADTGQIEEGLAADIVGGVNALHQGTQAAASGADEPPAVAQSLEALGG
jgi:HPt (histidine-containing phosphotransfer) domain-containing protein